MLVSTRWLLRPFGFQSSTSHDRVMFWKSTRLRFSADFSEFVHTSKLRVWQSLADFQKKINGFEYGCAIRKNTYTNARPPIHAHAHPCTRTRIHPYAREPNIHIEMLMGRFSMHRPREHCFSPLPMPIYNCRSTRLSHVTPLARLLHRSDLRLHGSPSSGTTTLKLQLLALLAHGQAVPQTALWQRRSSST